MRLHGLLAQAACGVDGEEWASSFGLLLSHLHHMPCPSIQTVTTLLQENADKRLSTVMNIGTVSQSASTLQEHAQGAAVLGVSFTPCPVGVCLVIRSCKWGNA